MTNQGEQQLLLDDIRSNDPLRVKAALERLSDDLLAHARAKLGRRQREVNIEAASIVQSVLVRELGDGADRFESEAHLRGRLHLAVEHKIISRLRTPKARTGQVSQYGDGGLPDPSARGPGVGTQISEAEQSAALVPLLTAGLSKLDREIVVRSVLEEEKSGAVGLRLGLSADSVRQRLVKLRPVLRKRLLEPARASATAAEWAVLNACLVERLHPKLAAELLGVEPSELSTVLERAMGTHLRSAIGRAGMAALERLLGREQQ